MPEPTKAPVTQEQQETPKPRLTVDERFRFLLLKSIGDVAVSAKTLAAAKNEIHAFCENLSQADKDILYTKATAVAKRIRDIADGITAETPSLLPRMMPNQDV